ncbi:GntR family transcriptional regulator [Cupriavidus sp. USMAHM13]|uniref:GntR family transcriptional regulator n=1 Tax=Cupriavidus malaysiensis TaxID=367825 RepID=A0ABM6FA04_9BURK|nr:MULTISPECIES: GntR family transcriptional regulator [Cupriavidus]AOZ01737.1 GntR family transcriptional regulator [Cupriavidus sp. USMAHM13]AOZ08515.1 GntR family transcriptional regulator [Cupriavidus malaysiensis]
MSKSNSADITRQLLDGITTGRLPVGTLLPTEFELCEQFQASRYTIRAVLQELQELGLVSRRKNVGTRVEATRPKAVFRPTLASVDDLVQFGAEHLRVVQAVETVAVAGEAAREIGCAEGTPWLRIASVRLREGARTAPMAWTDVYIDPAYEEIGEEVRRSPDKLVSALIESRYARQIAEIQQDVRASTLADARIAQALQLEPGAAVLKIVRRYMDAAGETFEVSVTVHPAESFSVSMRLKRSAG